MPKFNGSNDPEEYLSWALKVDKIFRLHNYEEDKKIAMASLSSKTMSSFGGNKSLSAARQEVIHQSLLGHK